MRDHKNDKIKVADEADSKADELHKIPVHGPEDEVEAEVLTGEEAEAAVAEAVDLEEEPVDEMALYAAKLERKLEEGERKLRQTFAAHRSREDELQKIRERLERDREKRLLQSKMKLFQLFLDPLDNLERSILAGQQSGDVQSLIQGVALVYKQFQDVLVAEGLEKFDPKGEMFDPAVHDAIAMIPAAKKADNDRIVEVHQVGYSLDDQVLRPARVVVAKTPS
jgi:molecular chaperone GrpE